MTSSEPTDNPTVATPAAPADVAAYLAAAPETVPMPPDLPWRVNRYNEAMATARQIAAAAARVFTPELREMLDLVRTAGDTPYETGGPYAPGGPLHEHLVAIEVLEGVNKIVARGQAAEAEAAQPAEASA